MVITSCIHDWPWYRLLARVVKVGRDGLIAGDGMFSVRQNAAYVSRAAGWILLLCILHVISATAAEPRLIKLPVTEGKDIRFTHLSTEEGLSQSRVDHVLQDSQGFLWIGTYNGLNRYDGYHFQQYKPEANNPNSIGGVFIYGLFQDRSGTLWIAVDQGLDRFDPVTERFHHYRSNPADPASLAGHVEHIAQDRDGMLWLSTRNGLDRLEPGSGRFTHYRNDPDDPHSLSSNDVRFVFEDRQGTLWVATAAGPDAFDRRTGKVIRHYPVSQQLFPLDRIFEDRSGTLWFSATRGGGVTSLDRETGVFTTYIFFDDWPGTPGMRGCSAILEDRHGMLWLATKPDGLVKFDRTRRLFTRYRNDPTNPTSFNNIDALSLIEDKEGGIWVGTNGGGVNRFPSEPSPFTIYRSEPGNRNSLDEDYILSVFEDSHGVLWIGTKRLNRLDTKTGRYTLYRHDPANPESIAANAVNATVEDRAGVLWFGTWGGGLNRFDRQTGRFKAYKHDPANPASLSNDYIMSLLLDHEGNVWAGTEDGLSRLDARTGHFSIFRFNGPPDSRIYRVLAEDADGSIWMGTFEQGLQRLDVRTGKIVSYKHDPKIQTSLSNNRVNALRVDHSGSLWVGTQDGLSRFDRNTGEFTIIDERDGLPNNAIEGILEDASGNLWLSTGNGLSKFDPRTRSVKNYFTDDGLPGEEFVPSSVYFNSANGEMFFGGFKGLTAFFPDRVTENPFVPPVVLTEFRLFGEAIPVGGHSPLQKSISFTNSLSLSHQQNNFSLEFASLSYANPLRNRYRYKLEGLDKQWTEVGSNHRLVTFPILPPGEYTFRVQGSSNRGVWNEEGVSLQISIFPPWWRTWWFRTMAAFVVLTVLWLAYHLRVRHVERRNRKLAQEVRERTAAEEEIRALSERLINAQEQERVRIAAELHDDLNQQITGISLSLGSVRRQLPDVKSEAVRNLEHIRDQLSRLSGSIRDLSHELHPAILDYCDIATALRSHCKEFSSQSGLEVRFESTGEFDDVSRDVALCIYRVTQEALQNVLRHAVTTSATVRLERIADVVHLSVSDRGVGFRVDQLRPAGGLGLVNIKERIRLVKGVVRLESEPGGGTTLLAEIPIDTVNQATEEFPREHSA